jgi:hypothetical protein
VVVPDVAVPGVVVPGVVVPDEAVPGEVVPDVVVFGNEVEPVIVDVVVGTTPLLPEPLR